MKIQLSEDQRIKIQHKELDILIEFDRLCKKNNIKYTLCGGTLIGAIRHKGFIPWDDDIDVYVLRNDFDKIRANFPRELGSQFFYQSNETDPDYFYPFDKIRLNNTLFKSPFLAKRNINHGLFIDIFPVDAIPDSYFSRWFQFYIHRLLLTTLLTKFVDPRSWKGKKRLMATLLRLISMPFKITTIYKLEEKVATIYKKEIGSTKDVCNFNIPISYGKKGIYPSEWFKNYQYTKFENTEFLTIKEYNKLLEKVYGNYMQLPPENKQTTEHDLIELKI